MLKVSSCLTENGRVRADIDGFRVEDGDRHQSQGNESRRWLLKHVQLIGVLKTLCEGVDAVAHTQSSEELAALSESQAIRVLAAQGLFYRYDPYEALLMPFSALIGLPLSLLGEVAEHSPTVYTCEAGSVQDLQGWLASQAGEAVERMPDVPTYRTIRPFRVDWKVSEAIAEQWMNRVLVKVRDVIWVGHDGESLHALLGRTDAVEIVKEAVFFGEDVEGRAGRALAGLEENGGHFVPTAETEHIPQDVLDRLGQDDWDRLWLCQIWPELMGLGG